MVNAQHIRQGKAKQSCIKKHACCRFKTSSAGHFILETLFIIIIFYSPTSVLRIYSTDLLIVDKVKTTGEGNRELAGLQGENMQSASRRSVVRPRPHCQRPFRREARSEAGNGQKWHTRAQFSLFPSLICLSSEFRFILIPSEQQQTPLHSNSPPHSNGLHSMMTPSTIVFDKILMHTNGPRAWRH